MTFSAILVALLTWLATHPAEVTLAVGALASFFYAKLDKYPRMQAFFALFAHMGVNLHGVAGAASRLVAVFAEAKAAKLAEKAPEPPPPAVKS